MAGTILNEVIRRMLLLSGGKLGLRSIAKPELFFSPRNDSM